MGIDQGKLHIKRVLTAEDIAFAALQNFIAAAQSAIDLRATFKVAMSGGQTPEKFFQMLGRDSQAAQLQWDKIHIFWVDERCVAPDDKDSNYRMANEAFICKVPIPFENIHRVHAENSNYDQVVNSYEQTLRKVFELSAGQVPQFDLIILGMGDDGHIASLFPNSYEPLDVADLVSAVYLKNGAHNRITLTHPVIQASRKILVLVSGQRKAETLKNVFESETDELKYPVHWLWPVLDKVTWIVDENAASCL
jgi:6-phosphogluconolactonase